MGEILQANIFFFITAASVIILTIFLAIVFYHIIKIVKAIRRIVDRIEEGSEILAEDFEAVRGTVVGSASMLSHLLGFKASMSGTGGTTKTRASRTKKKSRLSIQDED